MENLAWTDLGQPSEYTWDETDAWTTDSYDEETGALSGQDTYTGTGVTEVDALVYSYDNTGQLTEVSDLPSGDTSADDTQCFGYDYLGRITQAWSQGSATCGTPSVSEEAKAAAPYWEAYTYNDENDLTGQTSTTAGGTVTTTADTYPAAGDSQPHALSSRSVTAGDTTGTTDYSYDDDGNLTAGTGATSESLSWDAAGRLSSDATSSGKTSYIYDADGNLLLTEDPGSDTLYLDDEEITYSTSTGDTTATRYYSIDGAVAASRTVTDDDGATTTAVDYLTGNMSGTSTLAVDASTLDLTRRYYDPFGNEIASSGTWDGNKGFQNGAADDTTGLDDLGAREYGPATGSFISADPVLAPDDPQDLNPYAYAQDTAPSGEDPSGLYEAGPPGSGCSAGTAWHTQCGGTGTNPNGGTGAASGTGQGQQHTGGSDGTGGYGPSFGTTEDEIFALPAETQAKIVSAVIPAADEPGCSGMLIKLGACPGEAGAAGTTAAQVGQSLRGAASIIGGTLLGPVIEGLAGLLGSSSAAAEEGSIMAARTGEGAAEGPNLTLDEARAAAKSRGVDTSSISLKYQPPDDPFYADKYGFSRFKLDETPYVDENGQYEVTLTDLGLQDEQTAAMTIAHELGHLTEVGPWDEEGAEAFAIRLLGDG